MSVRVMADVWDFGPEDATLTNVLVVLANSADDDGGNCFPGTALVAARTRYSERTVIRAIRELERQDWIAIVQRGNGRPRGRTRQQKAGYMSQFQINVAKLKGCQAVTLSSDSKRVTLRPERVTLATQKGDFDGNPPHPLIGVSVNDPSETQKLPPNPHDACGAAGECLPEFTPEQQAHLDRCAANPALAAGLERWKGYYREENHRAAEKEKQERLGEEAERARHAQIRTLLPNRTAAMDWLLRKCGFIDNGRQNGIGATLLQVLELREREGEPPWIAAPRMEEAWKAQQRAGDELARRLKPVNFFGSGYWANRDGWYWNYELLRQRAGASAGSAR